MTRQPDDLWGLGAIAAVGFSALSGMHWALIVAVACFALSTWLTLRRPARSRLTGGQ